MIYMHCRIRVVDFSKWKSEMEADAEAQLNAGMRLIHLWRGWGNAHRHQHKILTMVTVLLMLTAIGFGAAAFGKWFRFYSIATIVILLVFGALTGLDAPRIEANLPTPWVGVTERINIGVFLLWVLVLAVALVGTQGDKPQEDDLIGRV
jgi:hypothetical protein